MNQLEGDLRAPECARFVILASRWNPRIVDRLIDGALHAFAEHGVGEAAVDLVRVPGAWELPQAAAKLASAHRHAGIVALGCVIRGETRHYEHVADESARGLMQVALVAGIPVGNGVLAVERHEDALARAGGSHGNKGEEVVRAVIEMTNLFARLP